MHWSALLCAAVTAMAFVAFQFFPGRWCEPVSVRLAVGAFVVITSMLYLWFVDDARRPKARAWHRVLVGCVAGVVVSAIAGGPAVLYALLALVGGMAGYVGFRWLKHVPL